MAAKDPSPVVVSNTKAIPVVISNATPAIAMPLVQHMIGTLTRIRYALFSLTILTAILLAHLYLSRYSLERASRCGIPDFTFDLAIKTKQLSKKFFMNEADQKEVHVNGLIQKRLEKHYLDGDDRAVKVPLIDITVDRHDLNPIASGLLSALMAWIMISLRQLHATVADKTLSQKLKPFFPLLRYELSSFMSPPTMTFASIVQIVILILPVLALGIVTGDGLGCVMSPSNNPKIHTSEWANFFMVVSATMIVLWMTRTIFSLGFSLRTALSDKPAAKSP